jgi:hypothetical protein
MSEKQLTPRVQLFQLAEKERALSGLYRSQSHDWRGTAEWLLYPIAAEIAGLEVKVSDILPVIFGDEVGLLDQIKNIWDFWSVVYLFALKDNMKKPLARSISEIRESNSRIPIDKERLLGGRLTNNELVQYAVSGAVLWSYEKQEVEINPLWLESPR